MEFKWRLRNKSGSAKKQKKRDREEVTSGREIEKRRPVLAYKFMNVETCAMWKRPCERKARRRKQFSLFWFFRVTENRCNALKKISERHSGGFLETWRRRSNLLRLLGACFLVCSQEREWAAQIPLRPLKKKEGNKRRNVKCFIWHRAAHVMSLRLTLIV